MGKKSKLAQKRREEREAKIRAEEEALKRLQSRRAFLKKAAVVGGLLVLGGGVSYFLKEDKTSPEKETNYSFIYRNHDLTGYVIPDHVFNTQCVRLGNSQKASDAEIQLAKNMLQSMIDAESAKRGITARDCQIDVSKQYCAKTFEGAEIDDAMQYSSELLEFMNTKVKGLDTAGISFHRLRNGEDWTRNFNRKVFFGDYYFVALTAEVKHDSTLIMDPLITLAKCGAMGNMDLDENTYFSFIPATRSALIGITSEVIPWTTIFKSEEYGGHDIDKIVQADETIAEGMSYIIGIEFGKIKGVPDIEGRLEKEIKGLKSETPGQYQYVLDSFRWLQKNGLQNGFDLYMDSPKKYLDAIKQ